MNMTLIISTKSDAVLKLIDIRQKFLDTGFTLIHSDTYNFIVGKEGVVTKVYWDGGFIESELIELN